MLYIRNQFDRAVEQLLLPTTYDELPLQVSLLETHISWVFLTDRFAYKMKKPVQFPFVDFSTGDLRHAACEEEVRLNRRLAQNVYLDVVPLTVDQNGEYHVDGPGNEIEWLVKMRKLRESATLESLMARNSVPAGAIGQLTTKLTDFYRHAVRIRQTGQAYARRVEQHVRDNLRELTETAPADCRNTIQQVHAAQLRFLRAHQTTLAARADNGYIVEGHGDLRPEHIYLESPPVIIDCVEFNRELRQCDVLDDLGFLAMECDRARHEEIGRQIVDHYRHATGDVYDETLLEFYKLYRACVRAKVSQCRSQQIDSASETAKQQQTEQTYLDLARRYAKHLGPPLLLVMSGTVGSGKSTLAHALQQELAADLYRTDIVRQQMFSDHRGTPSAPNQGKYDPATRRQVYEKLFDLAAIALAEGHSVILDGTFPKQTLRSTAYELAQHHGARFVVVHCHCPNAVARQRIVQRLESKSDPSEAQPQWFDDLVKDFEPVTPTIPHIAVFTQMAVPEQVERVLRRFTDSSRAAYNTP
ncbi:MAG: AAA family ATPase [Pirellulaceae bacterium]|nr:AAA family ATPase [Planctomycetales bacterium]